MLDEFWFSPTKTKLSSVVPSPAVNLAVSGYGAGEGPAHGNVRGVSYAGDFVECGFLFFSGGHAEDPIGVRAPAVDLPRAQGARDVVGGRNLIDLSQAGNGRDAGLRVTWPDEVEGGEVAPAEGGTAVGYCATMVVPGCHVGLWRQGDLGCGRALKGKVGGLQFPPTPSGTRLRSRAGAIVIGIDLNNVFQRLSSGCEYDQRDIGDGGIGVAQLAVGVVSPAVDPPPVHDGAGVPTAGGDLNDVGFAE